MRNFSLLNSVNEDVFLKSLLDVNAYYDNMLFQEALLSPDERYFFIMDSYFNSEIKRKINNNPAKMLGYFMKYLKKYHDLSSIDKKTYITFNSYSFKDKIYF